jgi:hypothetical protein
MPSGSTRRRGADQALSRRSRSWSPIILRLPQCPRSEAGNAWCDTSNRTRSRIPHCLPRHRQARLVHRSRFSVRRDADGRLRLFLRVTHGDGRRQHDHDDALTICTSRNRDVVETESSATCRHKPSADRIESVIGDPGEQVGKPSSRSTPFELAVAISIAMIAAWAAQGPAHRTLCRRSGAPQNDGGRLAPIITDTGPYVPLIVSPSARIGTSQPALRASTSA